MNLSIYVSIKDLLKLTSPLTLTMSGRFLWDISSSTMLLLVIWNFGRTLGSLREYLGVLWGHFGSTLGVTLGVFWAHFRSILGVTLGVLWANFVRQGVTLGVLLAHFGSTLGVTLGVFWANFRRTLGVPLGVLWANFGSTKGSLWEYSGLTLEVP